MGQVNYIRSISIVEAKKEMKKWPYADAVALIDIEKKVVLDHCGFARLIPGANVVDLAFLHGLAYNSMYRTILICLLRASKEVLMENKHHRLDNTVLEIQFPSRVQRTNQQNVCEFRLLEVQSEPVLLVYEGPETATLGSIDTYSVKSVFFPEEYFQETAIIKKQGKGELHEESLMVKEIATPFIATKLLSLYTPRQNDVLELLAYGKKPKEIASLLTKTTGASVTESTIITHIRDINRITHDWLPAHNAAKVARIFKKMGCF